MIDDVRRLIAAQVSAAGIPCEPYPPETTAPPCGWVDTFRWEDVPQGWWDGMPTVLQVVTVAQRNSLGSSLQFLEALVPSVVEQLGAVPGLRLDRVESGRTDINGQNLPTVVYTLTCVLTLEGA